MKTRSIGSLYNHVADLDPNGGLAWRPRIKLSEELRRERRRLFGRSVTDANIGKHTKDKGKQLHRDITLMQRSGIDFTYFHTKDFNHSKAIDELINYVKDKTGMTIREMHASKYNQGMHYLKCLALTLRFAMLIRTVSLAEELELDRADAQELISNAAKGLRRSIALDETMRELFNYLKDIMR
jgi:hypothetical protein